MRLTRRDRLVLVLIATIGIMLVIGGWQFINWLNRQSVP